MPEQMDRAEFDRLCAEVANAMKEFAMPYVTPISKVLSDQEGEHLGTGTYLDMSGTNYLITNEHVASHLKTSQLGHQFDQDENVYRITGPFKAKEYPTDAALSPIKPEVWSKHAHASRGVPCEKVALKHDPVQHELLFMMGFSGERSKFLALHDALHSIASPYLTQEIPLELLEKEPPEDWRSEYHFCLNYKPDLATTVGRGYGLPKPPGFSGSLIWDTRRILCLRQGSTWTPDCAVITGIVWGWPSKSACLVATRIEHVREFIRDAIAEPWDAT